MWAVSSVWVLRGIPENVEVAVLFCRSRPLRIVVNDNEGNLPLAQCFAQSSTHAAKTADNKVISK